MLIQKITDYCDLLFNDCGGCGRKCSRPSGKCSGGCSNCLREIQFHHSNGRSQYDCENMLRYYTCHTAWKRCSEILYALGTVDTGRFLDFKVLSIGCGAAPDLMAFELFADPSRKMVYYHGIDIASKWHEIQSKILSETGKNYNISAKFENRNIYDLFFKSHAITSPYSEYNVLILQYMIAGHIQSNRADKIDILFEEIIGKIINKSCSLPMLVIINDIDHKAWICDYFNMFTKKLRSYGFKFESNKRHFEPRDENAGSKLYKTRSNLFLSVIPSSHKEKYNANVQQLN